MRTYIHAWSGIRTHDPGVRVRETFHALDRAANVIGVYNLKNNMNTSSTVT
jgi:hypothetical protein